MLLLNKRVFCDGTFPELRAEDLKLLTVAYGGVPSGFKSADVLLAGEGSKKRDQAAGMEVISLEDLGEPLEGWFERLKAAVETRPKYYDKACRNFGYGEAASEALITSVMERIGFHSLALEHLMRSFNGVSYLWTKSKKPIAIAPDTYVEALHFLDPESEMWKAIGKSTVATIAFPMWEQMFLSEDYRSNIISTEGIDGVTSVLPKKRPLVGTQLFPLDYYHWYRMAGLYADRETEELFVLLADDHGASVTSLSKPIPFRLYIESLLAGGTLISKDWIWGPPGIKRAIRPHKKSSSVFGPSVVQPFTVTQVI